MGKSRGQILYAAFFCYSAVNTVEHIQMRMQLNIKVKEMMNKQTTKIDIQLLKATGKMNGMWQLMTGFRFLFLCAIFSLGISAIVRTGQFLLLKFVVDEVFPLPHLLKVIFFYIAGFGVLAGIEALFSFVKGKLAALSAEGIIKRLRNYLFDHIQRLPFTYHDHTDTGDLLERVTSDVDALHLFYSEQAIEIGRIGALFFFSLIAIFCIHPLLCIMSVICLPFILFQAFWFFIRIEKAYSGCQDQEAVISTVLQENISGIRVVQAFSRQDVEIEKFNREILEKYSRVKKLVFFQAFFWPVSDMICFVQTLLIYVIGGWMVMQGTITIGSYLAVMGLVTWAVWPLRDLGRMIIQASAAAVSYSRVFSILKEEPEKSNGKTRRSYAMKGKVEFRDVSFYYKKGEMVLDNITFTCNPGYVVALVGPTGSGKSTLINIIPGFYPYKSGSIRIDGKELSTIPLHELRRHIGIVEQEPFLFSRTIRENIAYGAGDGIGMKEIEQAAKAAAIHEVIMDFPEKYDTLIGERGTTLSGGQKQRIALARTILKNPRILILDDATSSVDAGTEEQINRALHTIMKGRTSFIIAHRVETVMRADLIVVLDRGKIIQTGTHHRLIQEGGLYKKIFSPQLEHSHTFPVMATHAIR
ncbi:MAG: ABC transporter ATP-binding protein [Spirochaetales bacterium]|nr:ABC transporter ATP-binding protein [Spirochaetales bacterium]